MCLAQVADVFGTGIVAGVFYMGWISVHPAAATLDASAHLQLRQELILRLARFLPLFMFLSVVASIAAMLLCRTSVAWGLDALGWALSLATIGITIVVNAPLNRRFARWVPDALPEDWETYVDRWNAAHSARTTTALAASSQPFSQEVEVRSDALAII